MPTREAVVRGSYTVDVIVDDGRVVMRETAENGDACTLSLTPAAATQLSLMLAEAARETGG